MKNENDYSVGWLIHQTAIDMGMLPSELPSILQEMNVPHQIINWERTTQFRIPITLDTQIIIPLGTIAFMQLLNGIIINDDPARDIYPLFSRQFHCFSDYQAHIPHELKFNQHGVMVPAYSLLNDGEYLANKFGGRAFMRPERCLKSYDAEVISPDSLPRHLVNKFKQSPSDLLWLFPQKQIQAEYRLFIAGGQITGISQYMENDEITEVKIHSLPGLAEIGKAIKEIRFNDPAYVMDIAYVADSHIPLILEVNAFSTSGWYKAEPESIVRGVNRSVVARIMEEESD